MSKVNYLRGAVTGLLLGTLVSVSFHPDARDVAKGVAYQIPGVRTAVTVVNDAFSGIRYDSQKSNIQKGYLEAVDDFSKTFSENSLKDLKYENYAGDGDGFFRELFSTTYYKIYMNHFRIGGVNSSELLVLQEGGYNPVVFAEISGSHIDSVSAILMGYETTPTDKPRIDVVVGRRQKIKRLVDCSENMKSPVERLLRKLDMARNSGSAMENQDSEEFRKLDDYLRQLKATE